MKAGIALTSGRTDYRLRIHAVDEAGGVADDEERAIGITRALRNQPHVVHGGTKSKVDIGVAGLNKLVSAVPAPQPIG